MEEEEEEEGDQDADEDVVDIDGASLDDSIISIDIPEPTSAPTRSAIVRLLLGSHKI